MNKLQKAVVQVSLDASRACMYCLLDVDAGMYVDMTTDLVIKEVDLIRVLNQAHLDGRGVALFYGAQFAQVTAVMPDGTLLN